MVAFIGSGVATTIVYQFIHGFTNLQLGLYLEGAAFLALSFVPLMILAVFLQVVSNNKFLGYLLTILVLLASCAARILGFEHNLYRYGATPPLLYSDMNGHGPHAEPFLWFSLYWAFAGVVLLVLSAV